MSKIKVKWISSDTSGSSTVLKANGSGGSSFAQLQLNNLKDATAFLSTYDYSKDGTIIEYNYVPSSYYGDASDGNVTISSSNTVVNAYTDLTTDLAQGATTLTVRSTTGFTAGKKIIVHQSQSYRPSNAPSGRWEICTINTIVNSTSLTITSGLSRAYYSDSTGPKIGSTKTQIILLKQYDTLTISGSVTASAWDSYSKGIVAIACRKLVGAGNIDVSAKGFRSVYNTYVYGEGWKGFGAVLDYGDGGGGRAQATGGNNQTGGGAGHLNDGQFGNNAATFPGLSYGLALSTTDTQPLMGAAGGTDGTEGYLGGVGGGIIFLFAMDPTAYTGDLISNGANGQGGNYDCSGGGGAGGSVVVLKDSNITFSPTITVNGGRRYDNGTSSGQGSVGRYEIAEPASKSSYSYITNRLIDTIITSPGSDNNIPTEKAVVNFSTAANTKTSTTNFNGNLSTANTTVQSALDTIDNLVLGSTTATGISASTTNFNGKLSSADNTVQKALDTLDDHSHTPQTSSNVNTTVTNFNTKLSASDDTVQKALDTLDDHTHTSLETTVNTTPFNNFLAGVGQDVQHALEKLDTITTGVLSPEVITQDLTNTNSITLDVSNIAANDIEINLNTRSNDSNLTDFICLRFNTDTGANYDCVFTGFSAGAGINGVSTDGAAKNYLRLSDIPGATAQTSSFGFLRIRIPNFKNTTNFKNASGDGFSVTNSTVTEDDIWSNTFSGQWRNTSAITSITIFTNSTSNFSDNSKLTIYGMGYSKGGVFDKQTLTLDSYVTTPQSIADSTDTLIVFDTESLDRLTSYNPSTGIWTAPKAMDIRIHAKVGFQNSFGSISLFKNSTVVGYASEDNSGNGWYATPEIIKTISVVLNDTVSIKAYQDSGTSVNTQSGQEYSYFQIIEEVAGSEVPTFNASEYVNTDTTNFDNNLSSADDTVQKALDTLDDLIIGASSANSISTSTTNFDNNLSSADDTVQKALDTIDDLVIGASSADAITVTVTSFDNVLSTSDTDVQTALETLDEHTHSASVTSVNTTPFKNILVDSGDNVQSALELIDKMSLGISNPESSRYIFDGTTNSITLDISSFLSDHLDINFAGRSLNSSNDDNIRIRFNSDSGTNYDSALTYWDASDVNGGTSDDGISLTSLNIGPIPAATSLSNTAGNQFLKLINFRKTSFYKSIIGNTSFISGDGSSSANVNGMNVSGQWRNTNAITSVTIFTESTSNFASGSEIIIYGAYTTKGSTYQRDTALFSATSCQSSLTTNNDYNTLIFATEEWDNDSLHNTSTGEFTVQRKVKMKVNLLLSLTNATNKLIKIYAKVNSTRTLIKSVYAPSSNYCLQTERIISLQPNDILVIEAWTDDNTFSIVSSESFYQLCEEIAFTPYTSQFESDVSNIDFTTSATTNIFTVPTGKKFILEALLLITESITGSANMPSIKIKTDSDTVLINTFTVSSDLNVNDGVDGIYGAFKNCITAGNILQLQVITAGTSTTHIGRIVCRGSLINA